jgi:hypothetical protein
MNLFAHRTFRLLLTYFEFIAQHEGLVYFILFDIAIGYQFDDFR